MTGYPWRPFALAVVFCAVAGWLDAVGSDWWIWPLYAAIWAYGAWRYQSGRFFEVRRGTCQENVEPVFHSEHLHECVRERGHRSRIHRCKCDMEWVPERRDLT